jgi:hypothetical protein
MHPIEYSDCDARPNNLLSTPLKSVHLIIISFS